MSKNNNFNVGDRVRKIAHDTRDVKIGDVNTVCRVDKHGNLGFTGLPQSDWYSACFFELVDPVNKQFTKSDLKAGKHVVDLGDAGRYLLVQVGDSVIGFNPDRQPADNMVAGVWYEDLNDDLTYPHNSEFDVKAVLVQDFSTRYGFEMSELTLVWEKPTKSAKQVELEKLQEQYNQLGEKINKLKNTL